MSLLFINEQDAIGDAQYAQELLNIQNWYNNELKRLNDQLAKKRTDVLTKYQERAKSNVAVRSTSQSSTTQNQTGTVTTDGQPVNAQGNPSAPKVESYPDILNINIVNEDDNDDVRFSHTINPYGIDARNWYQKPENREGYVKPKLAKFPRKKKMTNKVQDKIWDIEGEILDLKQELRLNKERFSSPRYSGAEEEIEQFFAEIGPEAAEILNSGAYNTDEEKIYALKTVGVNNAEQVIRDYYYYYPEYDESLKEKRLEIEKENEEIEARIKKLEDELEEIQSIYESLDESTFITANADPYELQDLKDYLDAENISYFEEENGRTIDFDESELDKEWQDRLPKMGLEEDIPTDDILSIEDEYTADDESISSRSQKIDEDKVFYVKVEDEGEAFVGKIYKLFNEGDWRSKIVDGNSETFEKLNYDPDWDEIDIVAFLRENYADAEIVSEEEFNDHVEEPEVESEEELEESLNERITSKGKFKKIWRTGHIWWRNNKKIIDVKHIEGPKYKLTFEDGSEAVEHEGPGIGFSDLKFERNFEEVKERIHSISTLDEFISESSKFLPGEYPNKGDQFEILAEYWPGNPYNHLSLVFGTHTQNERGTDKYLFKIGDIITYDRDNDWDSSFWKAPDGREGRIYALPRSLVKNNILKKVGPKFYR